MSDLAEQHYTEDQHMVIDCAPPPGPSPGDLSQIGTVNKADPVIQPYQLDARARPPGSDVKPFSLLEMRTGIRTMRSICPVPLSRPATRENTAPGHEEMNTSEAGDPSLERAKVQIVEMKGNRSHCAKTLADLKARIASEQKQEAAAVYETLRHADVTTARREWGLLKDRHARSKQDIWALSRELKQVQHHVTTSSRELQKRINDSEPPTAKADLLGSYTGVLGGATLKKLRRGEVGFGDSINNFASGVAIAKHTEAGIARFSRNAGMILAKHRKGQSDHAASLAAKMAEIRNRNARSMQRPQTVPLGSRNR